MDAFDSSDYPSENGPVKYMIHPYAQFRFNIMLE
jgi:hypothetical protein